MSPARHDRGSESLVSLDHHIGQRLAVLLVGAWLLLSLGNLVIGVAEGSILNLVVGVTCGGTNGFVLWFLIRSMGGEQR